MYTTNFFPCCIVTWNSSWTTQTQHSGLHGSDEINPTTGKTRYETERTRVKKLRKAGINPGTLHVFNNQEELDKFSWS